MVFHYCPSMRPLRTLMPLPLLLLGMHAPTYAASGDEAAFLAELPVVLSATRLKQSRHDTPTSVTVIDRHMIEASGARTIVDALRLVPGMQTAYATGNQQVVTYHGMSDEFSRRMQVLVDGRSIYLPSFGGIPWSSLPLVLEDIDRIEVIRGPNSATYGSNSFLGVISITTRHAAEETGTYTKITRGSDDIGDAVLRHSGHSGQSGELDYRITAGYQQDQGFTGVTYNKTRPYDNADWSRVRRLTARVDYQPSATDHWEIQAGGADSPQGKGSLFTDLTDPPRQKTEQSNFLQLRWERSSSNSHDFHVQFHRDEHLTRDMVTVPLGIPLDAATVNAILGVPFPGTLIAATQDGKLRTQRYDLEFQHRYSPEQGSRFVWGSSLRTDRARSEGWFGTNEWIYNHWFRLFGNAEVRLTDRVLVNAGAMLERNSIIGNDISPRLALNYRLAPQHSLRLAISKSSRTPAMIEEFSDVAAHILGELDTGAGTVPFDIPEQLLLSGGDLTRERITSREIGYFGELFDRRLQLDMRFFYDDVDALITQTTNQNKAIALLDNDVIDFEHTDKARIKGIETQLDWRPETHSSVRFGHSYIEIDSDDIWEHYSTSAPRNSYLLFASHRFPRHLDVSLAYHYTDGMEWLEWHAIEDVSRLDLRIAKHFTLPGFDAQVALVTQNVTGSHVEFRRGNLSEARAFVQLSLAPR